MDEHVVRTRHGQIAVADHGGSGPDVLLLHGASRTLWDWVLVLPYLSGRRVVSMDFRWHGLSSDEGDVGLEANADDVEDVVEALGLRNVVVAGHSLGGMTAAVYGTRHPEAGGIVNVDGYGSGSRDEFEGVTDADHAHYEQVMASLLEAYAAAPSSGDDAWRDSMVAGWRDAAAAMGWTFPADAVATANDRIFARSEDGRWHLRPDSTYQPRLRKAISGVSMLEVYRRCVAPLTIYRCRVEPLGDPIADRVLQSRLRKLAEEHRLLARERPNVTVHELDASHMVIFERPAEVAEGILRCGRGV